MRTDTLESHSAINSTSPQLVVRLPRRQNSEPADRILQRAGRILPSLPQGLVGTDRCGPRSGRGGAPSRRDDP